MTVKNVLRHPVRMLEYMLVPYLLQCSIIVDEMAAAVMDRGFDKSRPRTSCNLKYFEKPGFTYRSGHLAKCLDFGHLDMYVRMFDDLKRKEDDNPIGIIFCTDKDESMVKYSVLHENQQIFASKYMTVLPTVEELQKELERNQLIYSQE